MPGEQVTEDLLSIILARAETNRALAAAARRDARQRVREAKEWEALARLLQGADLGALAPLRPVPPRRMIF